MGGYGYNQTGSSNGLPSQGGGNDHSTGGDPQRLSKLNSASNTLSGNLNANAAQAGYEATTASVSGTAATGTSTAAGSAATSSVGGTVAGGGATASSTQMGSTLVKALMFYGGESVSQIKSNVNHQVNVIGTGGLKTGEDKIFYKNVHIPRKQV